MFLSFLRNIFQILMTRKWNRSKLKGLIYNHACGAHRYFLNREPKDFKNFNFMVDDCHMQGQRRMKKANPSTGRCHLGCSQSYSFMEYKPYTQLSRDGAHHSQGREQMHSVLEKLTPSLSACVLPQFHAHISFVLQCAQSVDNGQNVNTFKSASLFYYLHLTRCSVFIYFRVSMSSSFNNIGGSHIYCLILKYI